MAQAVLLLLQQKPWQTRQILKIVVAAPLAVFLWRELSGLVLSGSTVLVISVALTVLYGLLLVCLTARAAADIDPRSEPSFFRRGAANSRARNDLSHQWQSI